MRAALGWSVERGEIEPASADGDRTVAVLADRGYLSEGLRWLDSVLTSDYPWPPALRARALNGTGQASRSQGDFAAAQRVLEESLAIWRSSVDWKGGWPGGPDEMQILHGLGLVALYQADFARSQATSSRTWRGGGCWATTRYGPNPQQPGAGAALPGGV